MAEDTTTIEIPKSLRDDLRDARAEHERSYADTIERLLGQQSGGQLWTEEELRGIVREEIADRVVAKAQS